MADEYDVEALLDEAFSKKDDQKKKKHSDSKKKRSRRSRSRSRSRDRNRRRKSRSRSHEYRHHDFDRERRRHERRRREPSPAPVSNRVPADEMEPLTHEERDARTVFIRQLARRVSNRDIENFFIPVGRIRDVRIITDRNSNRPKGIAYVEFANIDSVAQAYRLSGQRLCDQPIVIQPTMSEKNRAALEAAALSSQKGPTKLYVGALHHEITEPMLRAIFEPFGSLDYVQLQYDHSTGNSKGFGFVQFKENDNAKHAMEKLNGFELAGKAMKVVSVSERAEFSYSVHEERDKAREPASARPMLSRPASNMHTATAPSRTEPPSCCVLISNAFDSFRDRAATWVKEVEKDMIKQVGTYASVKHIFVDRNSVEGNIYMKLNSSDEANSVVSKMKGRLYMGRIIRASVFSQLTYQSMFPNS